MAKWPINSTPPKPDTNQIVQSAATHNKFDNFIKWPLQHLTSDLQLPSKHQAGTNIEIVIKERTIVKKGLKSITTTHQPSPSIVCSLLPALPVLEVEKEVMSENSFLN